MRFTRRKLIVGGVAVFFGLAAIGSAMGSSPKPTATGSQAPSAAIALASQVPQITPSPTAVATATVEPTATLEPTEAPTPEPTAEPTLPPVSYAKLTSRTWSKLVKAPDTYLGRGYYVWACISQFDAATGTDSFRAEASFKKQEYWYLDSDNALFSGSTDQLSDFVQDDIVYMKVLSLGSFSYDTQIGGNTTVPLFEVISISRKGSCA
jgi:hypothetical protein